jgi:tricorn protease-like protein
MSVVFSEKGGFPYNTMTAAGNKLLMVRVIVTGGSVVEEYNPETNERKIIKKFEFDDKANVGEAIRQITSDEKTISLLRLKIDQGGKSRLFTDVYDYNMNFLRSVDVSTMPSSSSDSTENELRQGVANFIAANDFIYYANFSITRFLGKMEKNSLRSILDVNPEFEISSESEKSIKSGVFYQSFGKTNDLYLLSYEDGKIRKTTFNANDMRYNIINISRNTNDELLITMRYKNPDTGEGLEPRLYFVNLSDLKFKNSDLCH